MFLQFAPDTRQNDRTNPKMVSELECGICYQIFNRGLRCPRELQCRHSFCESCLVTLSSRSSVFESDHTNVSSVRDKTITCPLCRQITPVPGGQVRGALPVNECVLELLVTTGDSEGSDTEDMEVDEKGVYSDPPTEENVSTDRAGGGKFRRSLSRLWGKINRSAQQRRGTHCMTDSDMRDLALMSCYII